MAAAGQGHRPSTALSGAHGRPLQLFQHQLPPGRMEHLLSLLLSFWRCSCLPCPVGVFEWSGHLSRLVLAPQRCQQSVSCLSSILILLGLCSTPALIVLIPLLLFILHLGLGVEASPIAVTESGPRLRPQQRSKLQRGDQHQHHSETYYYTCLSGRLRKLRS